MTNPALRPIGTEFEEVTETATERVVTTWRVIGYLNGVELVQQINQLHQSKTRPGGKERK